MLSLGCNQVLGNEPGELLASDDAGKVDAAEDTDTGTIPVCVGRLSSVGADPRAGLGLLVQKTGLYMPDPKITGLALNKYNTVAILEGVPDSSLLVVGSSEAVTLPRPGGALAGAGPRFVYAVNALPGDTISGQSPGPLPALALWSFSDDQVKTTLSLEANVQDFELASRGDDVAIAFWPPRKNGDSLLTIDSDLVEVASTPIATQGLTSISAMAAAPNGEVYVVLNADGELVFPGAKSELLAGPTNVLVAYTKSLSYRWHILLGGVSPKWPASLAASNAMVFVGFETEGAALSFGAVGRPLCTAETQNALAAFAPDGMLSFVYTFGDERFGLTADASGAYLSAKQFAFSDGKAGTIGGNGQFLAKLGNDGKMKWFQVLESWNNGTVSVDAMIRDEGGGIRLAGRTTGMIDLGPPLVQHEGAFLLSFP